MSQELESLETLAGVQSFFLVVNPHDPDDQGFLGGTVVGREFCAVIVAAVRLVRKPSKLNVRALQHNVRRLCLFRPSLRPSRTLLREKFPLLESSRTNYMRAYGMHSG